MELIGTAIEQVELLRIGKKLYKQLSEDAPSKQELTLETASYIVHNAPLRIDAPPSFFKTMPDFKNMLPTPLSGMGEFLIESGCILCGFTATWLFREFLIGLSETGPLKKCPLVWSYSSCTF